MLSSPSQRRKTDNKPRDASTPQGSTTAESVRTLLKKNSKYSKRINYDALKDLFVDSPVDLDEKADDMYTMDDKSDGEGVGGMVVIEEEAGSVAVAPVPRSTPKKTVPGMHEEDDADADADADVDEGSDKGEDVWEDAYEQEV